LYQLSTIGLRQKYQPSDCVKIINHQIASKLSTIGFRQNYQPSDCVKITNHRIASKLSTIGLRQKFLPKFAELKMKKRRRN
jgi:hypothetical protein